jgi:hypothetical protein
VPENSDQGRNSKFDPQARLADRSADQLTLAGLELFDRYVQEVRLLAGSKDFDVGYYTKHRSRFEETLAILPPAPPGHSRAIELGATDFVQVALQHIFGYSEVHGTVFSPHVADKIGHRHLRVGTHETKSLTYSINLEHDLIPMPDEYFDLALCCEVLEHMDIDPMFMLSELNRVSRNGAWLVLTTPNSCSSRNVWKIAQGYRPHFFMQYELSRSPYRHNVEWDVHAVAQLSRAAGFEPVILRTLDVFELPVQAALDLLIRSGLPTDNRGDCIFLLARKVSGVVDRWPHGIYI